jgi:hypothetical protein
LDNSLVEALLIAGTTGAGLVLTAFSLVVSRAEDLLDERASELEDSIEAVQKQLEELPKIDWSLPHEQHRQPFNEKMTVLNRELNKVRARQALPPYFGFTIKAGFAGYSVVAILAGLLLGGVFANATSNGTGGLDDKIVSWLIVVFILSSAAFAYSGLSGIGDISRLLDRRWKRRKGSPKLITNPPTT